MTAVEPHVARLLCSVGDRVNRLRNARGWSARILAQKAGVSQRFVFQLEKGEANASLGKLSAIAAAFGCEVYELLQPTEPRPILRELVEFLARCSPTQLESARSALLEPVANRRSTIALLGMRGAGKSTIGQALASKMGADFVELDALIEERAAIPLADIFSLHGPEYYAELEGDCLSAVLERSEPVVLATGGGLVAHAETYRELRSRAFCIWLKASPQTHWDRVLAQGDLRPMANNPRAFDQLCSILDARQELYAAADRVVTTDNLTVDQVVGELLGEVS